MWPQGVDTVTYVYRGRIAVCVNCRLFMRHDRPLTFEFPIIRMEGVEFLDMDASASGLVWGTGMGLLGTIVGGCCRFSVRGQAWDTLVCRDPSAVLALFLGPSVRT